MESLEILQTIWFFILGFILITYSLLDGFDLGIGSLLPLLSKNDEESSLLIRSIGPVWDGNEVWLLLSGGAAFAAFPRVYATLLSGFYLPVMFVIFGLIFRAVSIEFWSLEKTGRKFWGWCLAAGSFLPSLIFGILLGNLIMGIPLDSNREFAGSLITLFRPFPLATGILGLPAILLQGAPYAAQKTGDPVREKARSVAGKLWFLYIAAFFIALGAAALFTGKALTRPAAWIFAIVVITSVILIRIFLSQGKDHTAFLFSSLAFAGLWGIAGSILFPHLAKGTPESPLSLSIYNSSSTEFSLTVMLVFALIGIPLVIGYTIFIYRIFRGKVD